MRLNKSTSYVLIALLRGYTSSAGIAEFLESVELRTIQRALNRLVGLKIVQQAGPSNAPVYTVVYPQLLSVKFDEKVLVDEDRPDSVFNYGLLEWLEDCKPGEIAKALGEPHVIAAKTNDLLSMRDLEHLTIELSWKSSALEGNTYSLLDTQLLLTEGIKPKNRTEFETQMILNHKDAIKFIVENKNLFVSDIKFSTVEELHRILANNLGIDAGVRNKIVKITASNYTPPETPVMLREAADKILAIISRQPDPYAKSLLALSLIPYLQIFEDGNKRTGRMLANAILIGALNQGFTLRKVEARELALAYLAFYEFNSIQALDFILRRELS